MWTPSRQVVRWLIKPIVFIFSLLPFLYLLLSSINNELGANPVETLTHQSGTWALYFLLMTLSITPLRQVAGVSWLVTLRRMLGLFAFFYACLHVLVYVWLDQFFGWTAILEDVIKRPYITLGFLAWLLLLPLAATSTKSAIKSLGKNWKRLHRLVYLVTLLVIFHFIWLVKADYAEPLAYLLIYLLLMLLRFSPQLFRKHLSG